MLAQALLPLLFTASAAIAANTNVYLIRHGEKPNNDGQGLSDKGKQRAQCLRTVFGASSEYNIGYIIAEQPQSNGDRTRPLETVKPLAADLGLTVDTSCDKEDADCVANLVNNYNGSGNILICWEHKILSDIAEALGDDNPPKYDSDRFDDIWTLAAGTYDISTKGSEHCSGLDD